MQLASSYTSCWVIHIVGKPWQHRRASRAKRACQEQRRTCMTPTATQTRSRRSHGARSAQAEEVSETLMGEMERTMKRAFIAAILAAFLASSVDSFARGGGGGRPYYGEGKHTKSHGGDYVG